MYSNTQQGEQVYSLLLANGEGIINRQSADDVCLFDLLACDASLICLAHFCM